MAKRVRDYKAEYATAKRRAKQAGYKSQREYKRARKALQLPRNVSPVPRRVIERIDPGVLIPEGTKAIRTGNARWSNKHSRVPNSKWNPKWDDTRARAYHLAFVLESKHGPEKLSRLYDYLVALYAMVTESEWEQNYLPRA